MALLAVEGLSVWSRSGPLLKNLSLSVERGEILGLVGESGAGKTLTALAILKLLPEGLTPTGTVTLMGRSLMALGEDSLRGIRGRDIGMVFQEPATALNPVQSIGTQVAEPLRIHRGLKRTSALAIAAATLTRVGLSPETVPLGRYPHQLSGGERQRVALAMATVLDPPILIADEPTTALDVKSRAQILTLIQERARAGTAVLLISHDLASVATLADRVVVLQDGQNVETGATERVLTAPAHPYTQALCRAARPRPPLAPRPIDRRVPALEARHLRRVYRGPAAGWFGRRAERAAVEAVSFAIYPGERVGLVGESGSGKTTLVRTLLGLEAPQAGEVLWGRESWYAASEERRQALRLTVGAVFQEPMQSFDPRWTVNAIVAEPLALVRPRPGALAARALVEAALRRVGLDPAVGTRRARECSGGERSRIALARALINGPSVLMIDETLSALDLTLRAQMLDLLTAGAERLGLGYLLISHDLALVESSTDRVLVMQAGRIIEDAPTGELFASPGHRYTAELLAASSDLDRALKARA